MPSLAGSPKQGLEIKNWKRQRHTNKSTTSIAETHDMSVHQLIAYHTFLSMYKILQTKKPTYIYNRFTNENSTNDMRRRNDNNLNIQGDLTLTRGGFMYRGAKLFNMIPNEIKNVKKYKKFKVQIKKWIKLHIPIKP